MAKKNFVFIIERRRKKYPPFTKYIHYRSSLFNYYNNNNNGWMNEWKSMKWKKMDFYNTMMIIIIAIIIIIIKLMMMMMICVLNEYWLIEIEYHCFFLFTNLKFSKKTCTIDWSIKIFFLQCFFFHFHLDDQHDFFLLLLQETDLT